MAKNKIIILTGMPGAGKGAISKVMKWLPNMSYISTGMLFRALGPNSELGRQVQEIMTVGGLVGDEIVNQMVEPHLVPGKDILLDGFPRSIPQVEWLLEQAGDDFDVVAFLLQLDEESAMRRRDKRINDYLLLGETPRGDDTDPTILPKRFIEYREKTEPTIEFLRQKLGDKFFDIDGRLTLEDVYDNMMKIYTKI